MEYRMMAGYRMVAVERQIEVAQQAARMEDSLVVHMAGLPAAHKAAAQDRRMVMAELLVFLPLELVLPATG